MRTILPLALFAPLADEFVSLGFFDFSINIPAADLESREAWASLGFGRTMTCAIRDVAPTSKPASTAVEMHQAGPEDTAGIFQLNEELMIHHARSPIFNFARYDIYPLAEMAPRPKEES